MGVFEQFRAPQRCPRKPISTVAWVAVIAAISSPTFGETMYVLLSSDRVIHGDVQPASDPASVQLHFNDGSTISVPIKRIIAVEPDLDRLQVMRRRFRQSRGWNRELLHHHPDQFVEEWVNDGIWCLQYGLIAKAELAYREAAGIRMHDPRVNHLRSLLDEAIKSGTMSSQQVS
ncbi:MAG: hypothetical protein AAF539_11215, partial [Planctomycetota bacterium]